MLATERSEFEMKKIREYLTTMIPEFDATDYKLKAKPEFLKKNRSRKPILSSVKEKMAQMVDCSVCLIRCDHILTKEQLNELRFKATIRTKSKVKAKPRTNQNKITPSAESKVNAKPRTSQQNRRYVEPVAVSIQLTNCLNDSSIMSGHTTRNEAIELEELFADKDPGPINPLPHVFYGQDKNDVCTAVSSIPQTTFHLPVTMFAQMNYESTVVEPILAPPVETGEENPIVDQNFEQTDDDGIVSEGQTHLLPATSDLSVSQASDDVTVMSRSESQLSTYSSSGYSSSQSIDVEVPSESMEELLIKVLNMYGESAKKQSEIKSLKEELRRKIESEQNLKQDIELIRKRFRVALGRIIQQKRLKNVHSPQKSSDTEKKLCIVCKNDANMRYVEYLNISTCSMACIRALG